MPESKDFFVEIGDEVTYSKTVGESDVYLFAGITGDLSSNHVNEQVMKEIVIRPAHCPWRIVGGLHVDDFNHDD